MKGSELRTECLGTKKVPEMRMLARTQPLTELVSRFGEGKANWMLPREKDLGIIMKGLVIAVVIWIK